MSEEVVEIDGSVLEGGGQILRISLVISALTRTPIRVYNIRAGRSKPGLRDQHLKGVELITMICNGKIQGAYSGSTEITLTPGKVKIGHYNAFVETAGSISLLMQVGIPCLLFAPGDGESRLNLRGGTNAEMAPQVDYVTEVFRPIMRKFGADFDFKLSRRGYFPRGGGEVQVLVKPVSKLKPVELLEQGRITNVYGWCFVAGTLPIHLARRITAGAIETLKPYHEDVDIECYKENPNEAEGNAAGIIIVAETDTGCIIGGSSLGKRGEEAHKTGERAAEEIIKAISQGACIDEHSQDQAIIFMALADGISKIRVGEVTMHTKTAIFIAEKLTKAKFKITPDGSSCSIIECQGIGLQVESTK